MASTQDPSVQTLSPRPTAEANLSWRGIDKIKYLIIFGASYCDVGFDPDSPHPTREEPLGVPFPGDTYAEPGKPNWVGHLITEHLPVSDVLVYNYARCGDRAVDVKAQVEKSFLPHIGGSERPWAADDSLFITWVGINDAAFSSDHTQSIETLFTAQNILYDSGARNFCFINLPPIHRSPGLSGRRAEGKATNYINWNTQLDEYVSKFKSEHSGATAIIFSAWDTFTRVLDNPEAHSFSENDASKRGGIRIDQLHPTSQMHDIIASDLAKFLKAQSPQRE